MATKILPLKDTIVLRLEESNVLPSGLVIPDSAVDPHRKIIVVVAGPDAVAAGVKPGQSIVLKFGHPNPTKMDLGDEGTFYVTELQDLAAMLEDGPEPIALQ